MKKLTVGSCFSGIGGLELGLEWTGGFETRWQIEFDPYASAVLRKHWPNAKRYGDITAVSGSDLEPVDVICGGYPCQPFSFAGKRKGHNDPRHLWPHLYRIICDLRPRFAVLENVPGHLSVGFGRVLGDLASSGYDAEWGVFSAAGVGAPHLRQRVFILANDRSQRKQGEFAEALHRVDSFSWSKNVRGVEDLRGRPDLPPSLFRGTRDGIPSWMDRLRCLGNAVVPHVAQKVGEMILRYEANP